MISVAVSGARGRVGRLIVQAIEADKAFLLAPFDEKPVDVLIDFTAPEATLKYLAICQEKKCPMVIGTTGFSELEKMKIAHASQIIPIVFSPNMSIGINISYKLLALAANLLKDRANHDLDISITDIHRQDKKDAPSGTALRMAEVIREACTHNDTHINISSVRLGDTVGEHSTVFALPGEQITISHKATDRSLYATGALEAAKWVVKQAPGLYDMQDVLQLHIVS